MRYEGRKPVVTLWLFCEGDDELAYFDDIRCSERIGRLRICPRLEGHTDASGLLDAAKRFMKKDSGYMHGDHVACVFDRNSNTETRLNNVGLSSKKYGIMPVFLNPCFEYWILCHYEQYLNRCELDDVIKRIKSHVPRYRKGMKSLYATINRNRTNAIANAKKAIKLHESKPHIVSRESNPVTLVHEVIKFIERLR